MPGLSQSERCSSLVMGDFEVSRLGAAEVEIAVVQVEVIEADIVEVAGFVPLAAECPGAVISAAVVLTSERWMLLKLLLRCHSGRDRRGPGRRRN